MNLFEVLFGGIPINGGYGDSSYQVPTEFSSHQQWALAIALIVTATTLALAVTYLRKKPSIGWGTFCLPAVFSWGIFIGAFLGV